MKSSLVRPSWAWPSLVFTTAEMATRPVTTLSVVTGCWAWSASCAGAGEAACPHPGAENISRHKARVALVTRLLQFVNHSTHRGEERRRTSWHDPLLHSSREA